MQHLLTIKELSELRIDRIFELAAELKKKPSQDLLKGKTLAMIFEKPSNRTRVSFEVGMFQLGGHAVTLGDGTIQLGRRESVADAARTLSRYVDAILIRTFEHAKVEEMAENSKVPVINALSDLSHPCQALADVFTLIEKRKKVEGLKMVFVGDGNNVARSLNELCKKTGIHFVLCCPKGYELEGAKVVYDPAKAVENADVIYTDVWTSMGQEAESKKRLKAFAKYQVNYSLVSKAKKDVLVMHCLPAHRGEEITDEVMESKNSIIFDQAENRLHVQKAILVKLLT